MTKVRTFKAATMQDALNLVREELGGEAVILHTRQVEARRIIPWRSAKSRVEVTAGLGVNVRPSSRPEGVEVKSDASVTARNRVRESTLAGVAGSQAESVASRALAAQVGGGESGVELELSSRMETNSPSIPTTTPVPAVRDADPNERLETAKRRLGGEGLGDSPDTHNTQFESKLDSIQKMLENLEHSRHVGGTDEIPSELFDLYTELIDSDVEDELARDLISRLKKNATPEQLTNAAASKALLTAMVESEIDCSQPIVPTPGRRKVVALVGPTGVGKTTTIAKLAANFRLRDGVKMGLVTVDTYRIAAVEQLRTYAEIIDLPMKVVTSPLEMRRALDELSGLDLVLIDTAGRSPRDELKIQELKTLLAEADVDEVHLVLSLTASIRSLEATVEKFSVANTTSIILTKLDEAAAMGALLSVSRRIPVPVSYLTTGQDVPDDIEPANASRMSRLVLGQDQLFD